MRNRRALFTKLIIGSVAVVLVAVPTLFNYRFAQLSPGGNDFIAHVAAWEAYFKFGYNPYSDEAALFTQRVIYGRPALQTEDQNRLNYPFYSIVLNGPFAFLGDYTLARALDMTLLQAALIIGMVQLWSLLHWRPGPVLAAFILIWGVLAYPQARGLILGQFAIIGFFAVVGALWLTQRGRPSAGGALLVLSTIKPTLVFLAIPFLLLWALTRRQWRFIGGFAITLSAACVGSWLMLPTWLDDWLLRVELYTSYTAGQSPVWLLTHTTLPMFGDTGEVVVVTLLIASMLWIWWRSLRATHPDWFWWAFGVTLVISDLIVPRSATTNYVLLLIPIFWLAHWLDRTSRGRAIYLTFMGVSLIGLWWLHLATVVGNQEQPIMFIPLPVTVGLALILAYQHLRSSTI